MPPKPQPQIALDEQIVESAELERVLEDREVAKGAAGEARKKFSTLDELAKGKIADLDLDDGGAVRVGRFRVTKSAVAARSVSFEIDPSMRLSIKATDER